MTSRGHWYQSSWKGDNAKAGGIATNIGIHFFDMLMWIFGAVEDVEVTAYHADHASGKLRLKQANVEWFLSINAEHLPADVKASGKRTFRTLTMEGTEIEFSDGFTDLHTRSYAEILSGNGFGIDDARASIELVYKIRNAAGVA
jgi:UDP-N-acetyl-2-amino-2-deoxyglucuronate dehydrogenase